MKYAVVVSVLSLAVAACSAGRDRPVNAPEATTRTTSSALTAARAPAATSPPSPSRASNAPDLRDPDKDAPNAPVSGNSDADRTVSEKIRQHLAKDPELANVGWSRLRIVTVDGHVSIAGELPTTADSCAVEQAVREVNGVLSVTNDIRVQE